MVATTWSNRSHWRTEDDTPINTDPSRVANGRAKRHALEVVEEEERTYVISHAGLLQRDTGLGDVVHHISKGVLIMPLVLVALAVPVAMPLLALGDYMVLIICLSHLILVATILTIWAIAVSYLDVQRGEEAMEARPMTAADGDPSMGARSPQVTSKHAA